MFGAEVASRFLEKWNTSFKEKVIQEARNLKETALLKQLLKAVLNDDPGTVIIKIVMLLLESIILLFKKVLLIISQKHFFPKTFNTQLFLKILSINNAHQ